MNALVFAGQLPSIHAGLRELGLQRNYTCRMVMPNRGDSDVLAIVCGGVVKKRVGLAGRGKRRGARILVATNKGNRWFFLFGFEKNDRANISAEEKEALQSITQDLLSRTGKELDTQVEDGTLQEICNDH